MSQDFLDSELITDFIIESREHLETIEPNLLKLEKNPENLVLLNDIFRPMHSLKGASGFLGLNRINKLAHRAENILDELRKGSMTVDSVIMDVILSATDAFQQMLISLENKNTEGDTPTDHIIDLVDRIMAGERFEDVNILSQLQTPSETVVIEGVTPENAEISIVAPESVAVSVAPTAVEVEAVAPKEQIVAEPQQAPAQNSFDNKIVDSNFATMTTLEWIHSLPILASRQLTAFGEAHLKDFIDEALENTSYLNAGLFDLEKNPEDADETVNNLFRFFHNLKGNSGIIGYLELNALTHESETLLNRARQNELKITSRLIDLLLVVVDAMEILIQQIDPENGVARPFNSVKLLTQLQSVVAGNEPDLLSLFRIHDEIEKTQPVPKKNDVDDQVRVETIEMFNSTVLQQEKIIIEALKSLEENPEEKSHQDALYRCFVAIQNSASFLEFEELKTYAQRTAGIVDQARSSDSIDFSCILSLLDQETEIMIELATKFAEESLASYNSASSAVSNDCGVATTSTEEGTSVADAVSTGDAGVVAQKNAESISTSPSAVAPIITSVAPEPSSVVAAPVAPAPVTPAPAPVAQAPAPVAPAPSTAPPVFATPIQQSPRPASIQKPDDKKAPEQKASSSIRVDYEKLDHLMNLIGELLINRNRYAMIAKNLEAASSNLDMTTIAQDLSETTYAMSRISDDLQDTLMKVRMLPVSAVFSRFPRLARDISRKSNKEVELVLEGEETELDKSIVESINDPLMHLVRNSLDHGIESPEVRIAAGKNPVGTVTLRAYHKGNSVVIEVEDDGKGIDPEKMREVAIRKGVITPEEAKNLSDKEATELIFAPGFSSAEVITDISGRGVGMDVVRTNIKNLKGNISIHTVPDKGTRFTLSLPLTLAIIEALMIKMGEQMYAIPLDAVATTTKLESALLTSINGRNAVTLRGDVLGIVDLGELLDLPTTLENDVISVVILQDNDRKIGLVVNQLLDRQEIVIKPLGAYLNNIEGLSGASIMGDGSVVLILDPHEIYTMAIPKASGNA